MDLQNSTPEKNNWLDRVKKTAGNNWLSAVSTKNRCLTPNCISAVGHGILLTWVDGFSVIAWLQSSFASLSILLTVMHSDWRPTYRMWQAFSYKRHTAFWKPHLQPTPESAIYWPGLSFWILTKWCLMNWSIWISGRTRLGLLKIKNGSSILASKTSLGFFKSHDLR